MSFWDSSAIVPLCLNESRSQSARIHWRRFRERYIWRETPVEIASAFARRTRERVLDDANRIKAEYRLKIVEAEWNTIEPSARMIDLARTFPAIYGLRALDSLQLAAALLWCKEFPKDKDFISADAKLLEAAKSIGFTTHDLS